MVRPSSPISLTLSTMSLQAVLLRLEPHPPQLAGDAVPARVLARLEPPRPPHHRRVEGLVGRGVAQDPVGVYARLVPEGVVPDYRLVGLYHHAGQPGDEAGGLVEQRVVDVGPQRVEVEAPHHELLQRGVPRPLPDAVDRQVRLVRPGHHAREAVRHRQAVVVVAVDADHHVRDRAGRLDVLRHLLGRRDPHRVGDVEAVYRRPR